MKLVKVTEEHTAFRDELVAVLRKHKQLKAEELLAVASYFVGQLIALQDQRKMTPSLAMQIVSVNIEAGNHHVIDGLTNMTGTKQ